MASQAQIDANRLNAQKGAPSGSGARTPEGKACCRRNATRHSLCADIAIMSHEEDIANEFKLLLEDLRLEHQPDGPTEDILVYKMAESFFFSYRAQDMLGERLTLNGSEHMQIEDQCKQVALMLRYHTTADRSFNRNLFDLLKLQKERRKQEIGFVVRRSKPAWSRECESLTGKEQRSILTPSLAWYAARPPSKRRQGHRWAG